MVHSPKDIKLRNKNKKLFLVFYIILAFVLIIATLDATIYLKTKKMQQANSTPELNIQGASQDLQNQLKNILNQ